MLKLRGRFLLGVISVGCGVLSLLIATSRAADPAPGTAQGAELHKRLTDLYLESKWDDLERDLGNTPKEPPGMTALEKADIVYLRQLVTDTRPAWWKQSKSGKTFNFKPAIWTRALLASFDPSGKNNIEISYNNGVPSCSLNWPTGDMDNTNQAEHGFTKGDLNNMQVWSVIGMADAWSNVPILAQANLDEAGKKQFQRYLDFRGNLAGIYYGSHRARRWGLFLYTLSYMQKYEAMLTVNGRRAIAGFLIVELITHGDKYPSLKLSTSKEDFNEESMSLHLKDAIEKQGWTFAEDKTLREAIKAFATANEMAVLKAGKVTLPNGLLVALDPEQDKPLIEKRNAWIKGQMERLAKKADKP